MITTETILDLWRWVPCIPAVNLAQEGLVPLEQGLPQGYKGLIVISLVSSPLGYQTGYQRPVPGNFEIQKPIYVSRFYEQHVAKNAFLLEGWKYAMALMQNQN